jgi:hypothetical protein
MYQEIDIKLNVFFATPQIRNFTHILDNDIKFHLHSRNDYSFEPNPIEITELESSITNMHIRLTTSINAKYDKNLILKVINNKIKQLLPWGISKIEALSLREEAEIYGNN